DDHPGEQCRVEREDGSTAREAGVGEAHRRLRTRKRAVRCPRGSGAARAAPLLVFGSAREAQRSRRSRSASTKRGSASKPARSSACTTSSPSARRKARSASARSRTSSTRANGSCWAATTQALGAGGNARRRSASRSSSYPLLPVIAHLTDG